MGDTAWHWAKCISEIESGILWMSPWISEGSYLNKFNTMWLSGNNTKEQKEL